MFERYNEKARRVIFFARYEASSFGSPWIETEHLLLAVLREDPAIRAKLNSQAIRNRITALTTSCKKISASVDLPLSHDAKKVLGYAAEEAEALSHQVITPDHLVLGLMRINGCLAADLLQEYGLEYAQFRETVSRIVEPDRPRIRQSSPPGLQTPEWQATERTPVAPSLSAPVNRLKDLVEYAMARLEIGSPAYGSQRLKRKPWLRVEAVGHLVDLASVHHQWFARALVEPKQLTLETYPGEEWVAAQQYRDASWSELVHCWAHLNGLLRNVLCVFPEEKLVLPCRLGIEQPITFQQLVDRYLEHCDDILGQILSRL